MPSVSQKQQSAFSVALAARRGEIEPDKLRGAAKKLFRDKSLSDDDLSDYAATRTSGLPRKIGTGPRPHIRGKRG